MKIFYIILGFFALAIITVSLRELFMKWHWICNWDYNVNTKILTCSICHRKLIRDGEYRGIVAGDTDKPMTMWKEII